MKIFGIGTDIVNVNRIKKTNNKFIKRVFSNSEINYCEKKYNKFASYAKRFAAKEAFFKALGLGTYKDLTFKGITVVNNKYGKPSIKLNKSADKYVKKTIKSNKYNINLSISDDLPWAVAVVVISYNG